MRRERKEGPVEVSGLRSRHVAIEEKDGDEDDEDDDDDDDDDDEDDEDEDEEHRRCFASR